MVGIGEGSTQEALAQIERLGARNIIIRSVKPAESIQREQGQRQSWSSKYGLTREDLTQIEALLGGDGTIVPAKEVGGQLLKEDRKRVSQTYGTTPLFLEVAGLGVARGRYLVERDLEKQALINQQVDMMLQMYVAQGFLVQDGNNIKSQLVFAGGQLQVNGKPLPIFGGQ